MSAPCYQDDRATLYQDDALAVLRELPDASVDAVITELVKIAPRDGTVLDPFMGSGTTGVAALNEGRRFIGVELTEHYARVAAERLASAAMKPRDDQLDLLGGVA